MMATQKTSQEFMLASGSSFRVCLLVSTGERDGINLNKAGD
jgi:hypothetical protein